MSRPSSIDRLSPELRAKIHELLARPDVTQQEITDALNAQGAGVSKSAVNRYAVRFREWTERNRQAREAVEAYLEGVGPDAQNKMGEAVLQMLRSVSVDLMAAMRDLDPDESPETVERVAKLVSQVARAVRDMESAASANAERRRKLLAELAAAAAKVEERLQEAGGTSAETIASIRRDILGVGD